MATLATTIEITPLMLACQNNNVDDVKAMLSKGASVDAKDSNNRTAIFYCAENIETGCVSELLKHKANINHQDKDGYSCLHLAVICGNMTIVEFLVQNGADINMTDSEMHSATHWSIVCGQETILDYLLASNADPETADIHGAYPIHYAAQMCGQIDVWDETINRDASKSLIILCKLINQKVKIDVEDFDQRNAIIWAASSGSREALLELFAAGGDPNKHEKDGLTALHCASSRNHLDCIQVLIENCKTSVDIMDNNNCTPIFYAATLGQLDACNLLIKYGANLHVQDCKGRTVFHCAAAKGQLKCLKSLCKHNSNIWLRNRRGDYPIHEAYYNKQMECLYYLIDAINDKRASRSSNMYDGRTILHLAAADNDLKLCKRLVADGVDVNCLMKTSTTTYMTPYDVAVIKNAVECAKYLRSLGGQNGSEIVAKLQGQNQNSKLKLKNLTTLQSYNNLNDYEERKSINNDDRNLKNREKNNKLDPNVKEKIRKDKENSTSTSKRPAAKNDENSNTSQDTNTLSSLSDSVNNKKKHNQQLQSKQNQHSSKNDENKNALSMYDLKKHEEFSANDSGDFTETGESAYDSGNEKKIVISAKKKQQLPAVEARQKERTSLKNRETGESNELKKRLAEAEREEKRRKALELKREKTNQKMSNLESLYAQVKSKSTISNKKNNREKSNDKVVVVMNKDSSGNEGNNIMRLEEQNRLRSNNNKESSNLYNGAIDKLGNNKYRQNDEARKSNVKRDNNAQMEVQKSSTKRNQQTIVTKNDSEETNNSYNGEKPEITKSKYDFDSDNEEINYREKKRNLKPISTSKSASKQNFKESPINKKNNFMSDLVKTENAKPKTTKGQTYDDFEDDDNDDGAELGENENYPQKNNSDTSFNENKSPQKSSKKRGLDQSSTRNSRREKSKNNLQDPETNSRNLNRSEDNLVRLVIKTDMISNSSWSKRRYASLFDKQRLILKSLYEIRRCRINNRDIIINSDLNTMLIKNYDFDIKKNCKSLKDLERMLELIAVEISDEYRKNNKRSHTMLSIKPKYMQLTSSNYWRSSDNIIRSEERRKMNDESKSKSQTITNESTPVAESVRFRQERQQTQTDQLKVAYKSLLPNDIYKQYYNTNTRYSNPRDQPPVQKEKSIILPVITQKPSFSI